MINIIGDKSILINKRNDCEPKKEIVLKDDFLKKESNITTIIKLKENYKRDILDGEYVLEVIDDSNYIKYISINGDSVEKLLSQKNDQYRLLIDNILGNKL